MNLTYERVAAHLDRLKLKRVAELLDPICEQASRETSAGSAEQLVGARHE